jgi:putative flippase GtrA
MSAHAAASPADTGCSRACDFFIVRGFISYRSELFRFYVVGAASAVAYVVLFVILRTQMPSQVANVLALLISAVANTAVNRRFTFGIRGPEGVVRHYLQGLGVFLLGLVVTSGSLWLLHVWTPAPSRVAEVSVLVAANLVATVVRFLGLRRVFSTR